ncbi:hypothetical protein FQA45_09830 [Glutamicibacter halophytocola]|uniref:Uncharacterized protein n=1 Tax=Glutamicibacter halophytocola TaxID=1933880 RepID=A0ABX5YAA6_9MICC|nr:hypothetical protein FQA45_09830 [Glutamicibacter halophytocola]
MQEADINDYRGAKHVAPRRQVDGRTRLAAVIGIGAVLAFPDVSNDLLDNALAAGLYKYSMRKDHSSITAEQTSLAAASIDGGGSAHYDFNTRWLFTQPSDLKQP